MAEFRALTVRQPYAWAIAHAGKTVENRSRPVSYRGPLAIHAGALSRWDPAGAKDPSVRLAWREWITALGGDNVASPLPRQGSLHLDFGAIIAVAELYGCHEWPDAGSCNGRGRPACSPWAAADQWHWQLRDIRPPFVTPSPLADGSACGSPHRIPSGQ